MIEMPPNPTYAQRQYYNLQPMNLLASLHRRPLADLETLMRALADIYFPHKLVGSNKLSAGFILNHLDKCPNLLRWEYICMNNIYLKG